MVQFGHKYFANTSLWRSMVYGAHACMHGVHACLYARMRVYSACSLLDVTVCSSLKVWCQGIHDIYDI